MNSEAGGRSEVVPKVNNMVILRKFVWICKTQIALWQYLRNSHRKQMGHYKQKFIVMGQPQDVRHPRMTTEDAMESLNNLTAFFEHLIRWDREGGTQKQGGTVA